MCLHYDKIGYTSVHYGHMQNIHNKIQKINIHAGKSSNRCGFVFQLSLLNCVLVTPVIIHIW